MSASMGKERIYIVLWMTGRCNLKCKYCYAWSPNRQQDMNFETAKKALDFFKDLPMKIQFAGGEPLLNYDLICNIYKYVKQQNYDAVFQLQTNGTLIDERIAVGIKKMRIRTGVSLDGPFGVNESLRGGTKLALDGIQSLGQTGVVINLNSTVTAQNVERLPELLELALYLGNVAGIGLDLIRFAGRANDPVNAVQKPGEAQLIRALYALHEKSAYLYRNTGVRIGIRAIEEAKQRLSGAVRGDSYCYASCGKSYVILPDGDVYPCGSLIDKEEYYMGNIIGGNIKAKALASPLKNENCAWCEYREACPGGCPSRMIINGDVFAEGSLDCTLRKTAFEIAKKMI